MKYFFSLLLGLFIATAFGQEIKISLINALDNSPFPGCEVKFIADNGSITQVKILRGITDPIDAESVRVIRNMPNWKPGTHKGKNVRTRCRIPINFTLR
ncbi:MAG: energy transducer TonB [Brumimicrobium sp.]|nr:energy transducer TonB [Brumimicrobium sp.]